jgi:Na+/H+ antiporter NhaC
LIILVLVGGSSIPFLSEYALPLVGLLFFAGGVLAGFVSGAKGKLIGKALWEGIKGLAPGIPLILMAVSIKHIVTTGMVMDTILKGAVGTMQNASPLAAVMIIYVLALVMELFIGSASAKAFLLMPILVPLGCDPAVDCNRLLLWGWFFQFGLPHQPGAAHRAWAGGGQLWQVDQVDGQTLAFGDPGNDPVLVVGNFDRLLSGLKNNLELSKKGKI